MFAVNDEGPVQVYVAPATVLADKLNVCPAHNGELAEATGAAGKGLIVTLIVTTVLVHPATVDVRE